MAMLEDHLKLDPEDKTLDWRDRIKARLARQRARTGISGIDDDGNHVLYRPDGETEILHDAEAMQLTTEATFGKSE